MKRHDVKTVVIMDFMKPERAEDESLERKCGCIEEGHEERIKYISNTM